MKPLAAAVASTGILIVCSLAAFAAAAAVGFGWLGFALVLMVMGSGIFATSAIMGQ